MSSTRARTTPSTQDSAAPSGHGTPSAPAPFAGRYWLDESLLITVEAPVGQRQHVVAKPFALLGSHTEADIRLPELETPKRALLLLAFQEGVAYVYLEADPPDGRVLHGWVAADEWLPIGGYRVSACLQNSAGGVPSLPGLLEKGSAAHPYPVVQVQRGGRSLGHRRYRSRLNLIGRREMADPRREHAFISTYKSAVLWEGGRLWIIDLLSKNGTRVDGRVVDAAALPMGGVVEIDDIELLFHRVSTSSPAADGRESGESSRDIHGDSLALATSPSGIDDSSLRTTPAVASRPESSDVASLLAICQKLEDERTALDRRQAALDEQLAWIEQRREELEFRAQFLDDREQALDEREAEFTRKWREATDEERLSRSLVSSYATVAVSAEPPGSGPANSSDARSSG